MSALERAVQICGGQKALADKIGVSQQAVCKWVTAGEVPLKRVIAIEVATDGQVSRADLCPAFFDSQVAT